VTFRDPIAWEDALPIRPSSPAWRATIKALYGSPLDADEHALFLQLSGGREPPAGGALEFEAVVGRRGGKSETIARLAAFEAIHGGHHLALAPGQLGIIPVISPLREQSQEIMGYARGLAALPQIAPMVDGDPTRDEIRFKTNVAVRVMTADAVNVSGPTAVCAVRDEFAKFPGAESLMSDKVIDAALRPSLAPLVGAPPRRLIAITSAYIREGVAFETDRDHYGRTDSDVLVVRGSTEQFNPAIDREWLARELRRVGPRVYGREYLAQWQDAVLDGWFGPDIITRSVDVDRPESPPHRDYRGGYVVAIDQAFSGDQFAIAVAHREMAADRKSARTVLDLVRAWRATTGTLDIPSTVRQCVDIARRYYTTSSVFADQFAFVPLQELFRQAGVNLQQRAWTGANKSPTFQRVRTAMTATPSEIRLPNDPALIRELHGIRGKALQSGTEQISARAGHDDRVHAAVMALVIAMERQPVGGRRGLIVVPGSARL